MPVRIVQVDAFTAVPFRGNPAAVCVLPSACDEQWMSQVAREMNLSETAFLYPVGDEFDLRWFTPAVEVALCGHATLASAHVLWEEGYLAPDKPARFHTKSGVLSCERRGDWIEMDFPATRAEAAEPPPQLTHGLSAKILYTGRSQFDYLVELEDEETVRGLQPDLHLLRQLPVRGIIVTARGTQYDFVSRFFAPRAGVDEDPVTGSAHCTLAPYWTERLGKIEMTAFQASQRGGNVQVRVAGDRVFLSGQAVTVLRGELIHS